jgi:hypothetical protein
MNKIASVPNSTNSALINEFHQYMKSNETSERYQNNLLQQKNINKNMLEELFCSQGKASIVI